MSISTTAAGAHVERAGGAGIRLDLTFVPEDRRSLVYPVSVLALLLVVWLVWQPPSPDLAAQVYRVHLFAVQGFSVWDNGWYGGHYVPDYSLLAPALAYLIGLRLSGVLAVTLSTLIFRSLLTEHDQTRVALATTVFALGAAGDLFIGRITFAVGVTIGLASVLAVVRGRHTLSAVLSLACAAASPVAGSFLVLVAGAALLTHGRPAPAAVLGGPAGALTLALLVLFPEGGYQPFSLASLLAAAGATVAPIVLLAPEDRLLRRCAQLYLAGLLLSYLLRTPMGSNVVRFGVLFAPACVVGCVRAGDVQRAIDRPLRLWRAARGGPAAGLHLGRGAAMAVMALAALLLVAWQVNGPIAQSTESLGPSSHYSFYAPVIRYLDNRTASGPIRIETPFTRAHWDAVFLGEQFDLARGWERQLDTKYDAVFYEGRLTAGGYRAWLLEDGVRYVALSDAPLDFSSVQEAGLIGRGLPFLRQVFRSADWRVYRVLGARPLAAGPGELTAMDGDGFTLRATRAGTFLVRVHYTPYWRVSAGQGSVTEGAGGWTKVRADRAGRLSIDAEFSLGLWP
jgi:hypothetical protein